MVGLRTQEQEADEKLWLSDLDRIKKVLEFFRILNILAWVAWSKSDKEILQNSADAFAEKATITIEKKDDNQVDIILNSQFPPYFKEKECSL